MSDIGSSKTGGGAAVRDAKPDESDKPAGRVKPPRPYSPKNEPAARKPFAQNAGRRPHVPILLAAGVHAMTAILIAAIAWAARHAPLAAVAAAAAAGALVPAGYRGLECLVHGAAHYDLFGFARADANDRVANLLFAAPTLQDVKAFRASHNRHHQYQSGGGDPCRNRMAMNAAVQQDNLPTIVSVLRRVPAETLAFYRQAGGSRTTLLRALAWHLCAFGLLGLALQDWSALALAWAAVYLPAFTVVLPVIRALGEAGEHDYRLSALGDNTKGELQRTFNNDGLLNWLLHPFGDHFHVEHHEFPSLPQYNLYRLHAALMREVPGYAQHAQRRVSVLGPVAPYARPARPANDNLLVPANTNAP